jgi:ubiquitin carboxyl-terminal hydrolase 5/13
MLIFSTQIRQRYLGQRERILASSASDPATDFGVQMSKVVDAQFNERYALPLVEDKEAKRFDTEKFTVAPRMFKSIVGQGHSEFSSGRQQDASEYYMHLLQIMSRFERTLLPRLQDSGPPTASLFEFQVESRYECQVTGQVRYVSGKQTVSNTLELRIPLDRAINKEEVDMLREAKKARIESKEGNTESLTPGADEEKLMVPFEECLNTFFGNEVVDYNNPTVGHPAPATKSNRMHGFPRYLMVKLGRYYVGDNWVQVKIDARVPMPEELDLSRYRATGPQSHEVLMPESASGAASASSSSAAPAPAAKVADESVVAQLVSMGFSENGSRKAAMEHNDVEMAMNWILMHMEDPDFNDPPVDPSAPAVEPMVVTDTASDAQLESIGMIVSMGYTEDQAKAALRATDNNLERFVFRMCENIARVLSRAVEYRALDWIFSHIDDLDAAVAMVSCLLVIIVVNVKLMAAGW